MDGFLSFIFYCIVGFYLLGFLGRLALRFWLRRMQKRYEQNPNGANFRSYTWGFGNGNNQQQQQQDQQKKSEGQVTVEAKEQAKRVNKNIGEYVDFEEIKDQPNSK